MTFPTIDYAYYSSVAALVFNTDKTFGSITAGSPAVIYVNGSVTLGNGTHSGLITIVATGNININGVQSPADANSFLALINMGDININNSPVHAIMYSHKWSNNAQIHVRMPNVMITGCAAADDISLEQTSVTVTRDTVLTLSVMKQLRLPGL